MPCRPVAATCLVSLVLGLTCLPVRAATPLATVEVAAGATLNRPLFVCAPPGDTSRLFIVEKRGAIRILNLATDIVNATAFLDIDAIVWTPASNNDERGMLGLAFHPNYAANGFFYVNYINNSGNSVVARYTVSGNPDIADSASALQILTIVQPFGNHNGGWLAFGPNDGYLYLAFGDGGDACDTGERAQDITNQLLGKILRIDINSDDFPGDATRFYAIPPTNPFVGVTGDDEIWAYGVRNPWRNAFDRLTGDLYIADVGQDSWEEINFQPASVTTARNYGWDCREGNHCSTCATVGCSCAGAGFTNPIHEYANGVPSPCSITGGYVYRGNAIPDLQGTYFYADYCSAQITSFYYDGVNVTNVINRTTELDPPGATTISNIVSFGEDGAGELYIVEQCGTTCGEVFKIIPNCTIAVSSNPSPQSVCQGGTAMFSCAVTGNVGSTTYTWQRNNVSIGAPNSPTLTLNNVQPADAGNYRCVIQDTCNTVFTTAAALTVNLPGPGDMDADCDVDLNDVPLFVNVLTGLDLDPGRLARANVNGDGNTNGLDVDPFVDLVIP